MLPDSAACSLPRLMGALLAHTPGNPLCWPPTPLRDLLSVDSRVKKALTHTAQFLPRIARQHLGAASSPTRYRSLKTRHSHPSGTQCPPRSFLTGREAEAAFGAPAFSGPAWRGAGLRSVDGGRQALGPRQALGLLSQLLRSCCCLPLYNFKVNLLKHKKMLFMLRLL